MSSTLVVVVAGLLTAPPQGARYRRLQLRWRPMSVYRQHPPGGPPSTSSTSVVAAVGLPTASPRGPAINVFNFGGACCRSTNSTPRGPANDVFISSGGCCWPSASTPQGAHHRHLQLQWRPLPVYRHNPPGGPPSVSSTSVVATVGLPIATPRGPAIDVFNFGGDRCRSTNSTPRGGPPSMSSYL
jgi:hypothetical protein